MVVLSGRLRIEYKVDKGWPDKAKIKMEPTSKKTTRWIVGAISLLGPVLTSLVLAEEIYKVVDEDGNVTYSTEPPKSSQTMEVIQAVPAPSEADTEAARQRQKNIEDKFEKQDQARAEQAQADAAQQNNSTTTIIHTNTPIAVNPYYYPRRYRRSGGGVPGHRRPGHPRPPSHKPRPPIVFP